MHNILCGADRPEEYKKYLAGRRVGMLTNASGVDHKGKPTYESIAEEFGLRLLLAPEHGIRTNLQDGGWGNDEYDPETGARVFSMKSKGNEHLDELLSEVDIVVYDIQDVGARFYTYLYNLTELMRRAAPLGVELLILDRPNPVSGVECQGLMLDESRYSSFVGEYSIPTRYGLTVGEFARYINDTRKIGCKINIVPLEGWERHLYADETDLLFVNPSPNIPSVGCAINYLGTCIFEATNISEGRGTTRPFDLVGAPFVDSRALKSELDSERHEGVVFRRAFFTPGFNKHAGQTCEGVELHITDRALYDPISTAIRIFRHMRRYPEFTQRDSGLCLRFGTDFLLGDADPDEYRRLAELDRAKFRSESAPYLIYQ